jgi:membrane-bound metal-dependent hydrolase YbcI (DUF457 family)
VDNVTHTLFALTLARTPLGRAGRGTTAALVIASNAPDIDIVTAARGAMSYLTWHRGPTHGLLGVAGLGVASGGLAWIGQRAIDRRRSARGGAPDPAAPAAFGMLASISMIAVLLHILMDLPTSYGVRLFSPFDWHWFSVDWMPIIDVYLLTILAAGVIFGELSKGSRRRLAAIALLLTATDYGVRAFAHHQALTLAPRLFGPLMPQPCDPHVAAPAIPYWPRAPVTPLASGKPCLLDVAAVPTPFSPFRWRVIAELSNGYDLHELDVLDARLQRPAEPGEAFWRRSVRYPNQWTAATFVAAATPMARRYLGFSRFPAARSFVDPSGMATVRWSDMRFAAGFFSLTPGSPRGADRLTFLVRLAPDGRVLEEVFSQ